MKAILLGLLGTVASIIVLFKIYQTFLIVNQSVFSSPWTFGYFLGILLGIIPLAGLAIFGGATLLFILRLFDNSQQVIITVEGIEDKRLNTNLIKWSEIAEIARIETKYAQWLSLILWSPEKYFDNLPTFQKFLRKANGQVGSNNFRIRFNDLDTPIDEVFPYIEKCFFESQNVMSLAE